MSADLQVEIFSKPKALAVPIDAVHRGPKGGKMVTLKLPKGGGKEAPVKTGVTTPSLVEITSGLKAGDQVVVPEGMPGS